MRDDQAPGAPGVAPPTQADIIAAFYAGQEAERMQHVEQQRRGGGSKLFGFIAVDAIFGATGHPFGWFMLFRDLLDGRGRRR